jgi:mRNA-degrading endonuclease toxin of MazEF toxin-antitoxin module
VEIDGRSTRVLVEQARVVDPRRLGEVVGALDHAELRAVDEALRLVLDL